MKKKILLLVVILVVTLASAFVFLGCDSITQEGVKDVTIIIGEQRWQTQTEVLFLTELLEELEIPMTTNSSPWGVYINSIGGINPAGNQYIQLWVNSDNPRIGNALDTWNPPFEYDGIMFYYAQLGALAMPVWDGFVFKFALGSF